MHDGLGFKNLRTGLNYTMEWYELDQLFNCTFPHVLPDKSLKWCNQGALCSYDGINDHTWTQYGTIDKVAVINGSIFNQFTTWANHDNDTAVYYETWTVYNTDKEDDPNRVMYFDSFDCASWTLRFDFL
jgi:ceroid-lipofuscinosis neuronal protein 5